MRLDELTKALRESWNTETSSWGDALPSDNPARGQCAVSALVMQDFLGGKLCAVQVDGDGIDETHYFNILDDGTVIDTTRQQYQNAAIRMTTLAIESDAIRQERLSDDGVKRRYDVLKSRVAQYIDSHS